MRTKPIAFTQSVSCSDDAYTNGLYTLNVDYINLEKLLKDEGLITEIETINPFKNNNIYYPFENDNILKFKIYHNTNIRKGIFEKLIPNSFVYAEDYNIKKIKITSKNYYLLKKRNKRLFDSDEYKDLLSTLNTPYDSNYATFVKTIPIDNTTTIRDIKNAIDDMRTITTFVNDCIDEIETPARDIIKKHHKKAITKKT